MVATVISISAVAAVAYADPLKSTNYQFQETSLGGIGSNGSHSAHYQTLQTAGILGIGNSAGPTMQINNGHQTTNDPALAFAVDTPSTSLGNFSPGTAAVATSTFEVSNYTSWGYVVQIMGTPPTNGAHVITAMSTLGTSTVGTEQFGINLVANTSPSSFGANPDHHQFGAGSAATGYNTANNFQFVSGDTLATASQSSGYTTYTISYIVNVNSFTPGGQYTSDQTLVCTGTY